MEEEKQKQIQELQDTIAQLKSSLVQANGMLRELQGSDFVAPSHERGMGVNRTEDGGQVVEGRFDGKDMAGSDGKRYTVPANYSSKSKLVEGDGLKLTISSDGTFVYKQIGPVERIRLRGSLLYNEDTGEYQAMVEGGKTYKLLKASVTYYKGEEGDEVIVLVPEDGFSKWAALENIIKLVA